MKNFDIEKLERKNAFKTPENFFPEVQKNVLQQTVNKPKEAKVFKMNFNWAIAATIALIFGVTVFFYQNNQIVPIKNIAKTTSVTRPLPENTKTNEAIAYEAIQKDLTIVEANNQTKTTSSKEKKMDVVKNQERTNQNTSVINKTAANTEEIDQVLASFSTSELAELSKNSDQDVYLDLYN